MDCIDKLDDILRKFHLGQYTEIRLNNELLMLLRAVQMAQIKECAKNARIKKYVKVGTRQDELKYSKSFKFETNENQWQWFSQRFPTTS